MGAGTHRRVRTWGQVALIAHAFALMLAACDAECPRGSVRVGDVCRSTASAGVAGDQALAQDNSAGKPTISGGGNGGDSASVSTAEAKQGSAGHSGNGSTSVSGAGAAGGANAAQGGTSGAASGSSAGSAAASCMPSNSGTETCDGKDNDCDGMVDEQVTTRCWVDADGDGYAALDAKSKDSCDMCGEKQTANDPKSGKADCADDDATRSPGATDICGDAIDNDCDGAADNSQKNACNGPCTVQLPGKPGEPCSNQLNGACARMGVYECKSDGTLHCTAEVVQGTPEVCGDNRDNDCDGTTDNGCMMNSCGGWTSLANPKGSPCSMGEGSCQAKGTYDCVGTDDTACNAKPKPKNSCGGCAVLAHDKGEPCSAGKCSSAGKYVCNGTDAISCDATAKEPNACGGCTALNIGASCSAECNTPGRTMCDGTERTKCVAQSEVVRNECGGCNPIPPGQSARAGDVCSKGTVVSCIDIAPWVCTGTGDARTTTCSARDNRPNNACNGCGVIGGAIGTPCTDSSGAAGTWQCDPSGSGLGGCVP